MKIIMLFFGLLISTFVHAKTLDTQHFKINISCISTSYENGCQKANYQEINKKTGAKLNLIGRQIMKACEPQKTPCQSIGYEFNDGKRIHFVAESGQLQVLDGPKVLIDESGTWAD